MEDDDDGLQPLYQGAKPLELDERSLSETILNEKNIKVDDDNTPVGQTPKTKPK